MTKSDDAVYYTNSLILLVRNMLCSEVDCQKVFDLKRISYKMQAGWRIDVLLALEEGIDAFPSHRARIRGNLAFLQVPLNSFPLTLVPCPSPLSLNHAPSTLNTQHSALHS